MRTPYKSLPAGHILAQTEITMLRDLEYTLTRTKNGEPLVQIESPLGNGQEIQPERLRALANALNRIADDAERYVQTGRLTPEPGAPLSY